MKKFLVPFLAASFIVVAAIIWIEVINYRSGYNLNMKLTSPAFLENQFIPSKYTCDGDGINPELNISDVPKNAKSLVLIMHDPDAPIAGGFTHWTIWNIDPKITSIAENNVPKSATEGITSFGKTGYGGPCPHQGTHHYNFQLYALDTVLNLEPSSTKDDLERAITGHILDQTELTGLYKRG